MALLRQVDLAAGDAALITALHLQKKTAIVVQIHETPGQGFSRQAHLDLLPQAGRMAKPGLANRREAVIYPAANAGKKMTAEGFQEIGRSDVLGHAFVMHACCRPAEVDWEVGHIHAAAEQEKLELSI